MHSLLHLSAVDRVKSTVKQTKPLGGTAAPFSCGSTDNLLLPHICWGLPTPRPVSLLDTVMLCGAKSKQEFTEPNENPTGMRESASQAPVRVLVRAAPPVFAVVVIRTGISLTAQARRLLTQLSLVVGQHVGVI